MMTPAIALFTLWLLAGVVPVHLMHSEGGGVWPMLRWAWRNETRWRVGVVALVSAPAWAIVCTWRLFKTITMKVRETK